MLKKYISFFSIICLVILPIIGIFDSSKAAVAPEVGVYINSINPQTDWSVMALRALGEEVNDDSFLHEIDGETANDYATYILAITSLGEDPRSFGNKNLVYLLRELSNNGQIGEMSYLNDDIFGLIALRSAGVPITDSIVVQEINYIKSKQTQDGGWSWDSSATEAMVDYTAMGIMALLSANVSATDSVIINAVDFLINAQNNDGGFGMSAQDASNTASTSWALSAINALNQDINFYRSQNLSPVDYLNARQSSSGYFFFDENSSEADLFTPITSSYAAIALSGKYYPIVKIPFPTSVSLRIEGQNNTICLLENAQARTALDVIKASADECGYDYTIQDTQYGPYLSKIATDTASGVNGWSYLPNYSMPQVGAGDYIVSDEDELIWYYGAWDDKPLRVNHSQSSVSISDTTIATVEQYINNSWSALSGATLKLGIDEFTTDLNGQVFLSWPNEGVYYIYAQAVGNVRSEKVMVMVGDALQSKSIGMSVTIDQGIEGNPIAENPEVNVIFGVSGDLSFGILKPGQSLTKQAIITNSSDSSISTTATIEGSSLFADNITLDNVTAIQWQQVILQNMSKAINVMLSIPQSYSGSGTEQATLIFWANVVE